MNEKRNVKLRGALLRALAVATFTAVSATAFTPVAQARVLLDEVNDNDCDLGADDTGDGSAADPFRISTVEDLAEVGDCDYFNGSYFYSLENDLDISPDDNYSNDGQDWNTTDGGWEPIGEFHSVTFSGQFDGNGHTIEGLSIDNSVRSDDYIGLFSEVDAAVIKDLTIDGEIDATEDDYVGILAGGDDDSQISNVHIIADITNGSDWVGGLLGLADGTRMSNITTTGDVVAIDDGSYIGGIIGESDSGNYEPSLTDSSSDVNVNDADNTDNYNNYVGGLVGDANYLRLLRSSFDGTVTGSESVGGLVGQLSRGLIHDSTVTEDSQVIPTSDVNVDNIGGLAGELDYSSISGSSFRGTISPNQNDTDLQDLGGIAGDVYSSYLVNVHVASTAIIDVVASGSSSDNVGGIAGNVVGSSVSGAAMYANLTVYDANRVGGLIGGLNNSQLDSSINRGHVHMTLDDISFSGSEGGIGGLVGNAYDGASVTDSTNKGDVIFDGDQDSFGVGGIVGVANEVHVTDNYNTGDVSGVLGVAGVVGTLTTQASIVQRNFSLGKLTGSIMDPDGIATVQFEEGPGDELSFNEPSNVVLESDRADNETGATEMTAAQLKTASALAALGWNVGSDSSTDWQTSVHFNSGFPHLAWETVSEDIDEEIGLMDTTFQEIITFLGGKRKLLRTAERNALNEVVELVEVNAYDTVEVHVYYGSKVKLAQKRGLNVKRWLVRMGVAQAITVYVHSSDNNNPVGSVTIEALVD